MFPSSFGALEANLKGSSLDGSWGGCINLDDDFVDDYHFDDDDDESDYFRDG